MCVPGIDFGERRERGDARARGLGGRRRCECVCVDLFERTRVGRVSGVRSMI